VFFFASDKNIFNFVEEYKKRKILKSVTISLSSFSILINTKLKIFSRSIL